MPNLRNQVWVGDLTRPKDGVVALSRSMAACYTPQKIRVNVIAPVLVRTPASERSEADPALSQFLKKKQPPTDGMFDATEVARAALFLLGEESPSITGEISYGDSGWTLAGL